MIPLKVDSVSQSGKTFYMMSKATMTKSLHQNNAVLKDKTFNCQGLLESEDNE